MPSPSPSNDLSLADAQLLAEYHRNLATYERTRRIAHTELEYHLTGISSRLRRHERLEVRSRVKSFDGALVKLKNQWEGGLLPRGASFSLLKDMVGVKVVAFPIGLWQRVDRKLGGKFRDVRADHKPLWKKYFLRLRRRSIGETTSFELQIVPFIRAQFLDVEHDVIYERPDWVDPRAIRLLKPLQRRVLGALEAFERKASEILRPLPEA